MADEVRSVARSAEHSPLLRALARAGYVANALVHALVGVVILVASLGGGGEADQTGAFRAVAAAPWGFVLLWAIAIGLLALALWHVAAAIGARRADRAKRLGILVAEIGQASAFAVIGVVAAAVAIGARPSAEQTAEDASRGILTVPGGAVLLGAAGIGVAVAGIVFVVMGVRRSFRNKVDFPESGWGHALSAVGVVGFVAKGVALGIIGVLLVIAAVRVDPDTAGGLDGAVEALLRLPYGPLLGAAVGVGFLFYAVFTVFRARFARLRI
ncbi:DUF1206 domain-containing protein [Microbacterium sp. RD1]|uniref:DUF1206 domain-containing protein n=1 Tax=Microbacterium sp. RD1 TaxID=3457313 RepID=UPI003FA5ED76